MEKITLSPRKIQFQVDLPEELVWPFVKAFGQEFREELNDDFVRWVEKPIDGIKPHSNVEHYYHVLVSVPLPQQVKLADFTHRFCDKHGLSMKMEALKDEIPKKKVSAFEASHPWGHAGHPY